MSWEVEYTDEFGDWWNALNEAEQDTMAAQVLLLEQLGPHLGFPHSSGITGSKHSHMRELRIQHKGDALPGSLCVRSSTHGALARWG